MAERLDIVIRDAQVVTQNTRIILAWDFDDRDGQSFTITSGTVSIFTDAGEATGVVGKTVSISNPGNGRSRVEITLLAAETAALAIGAHHARIELTFADAQTRRARAALRIRDENF